MPNYPELFSSKQDLFNKYGKNFDKKRHEDESSPTDNYE